MHHDRRVREAVPLARLAAAEEKGAHGRGLADADCAYRRGNVGHRVIDCEAWGWLLVEWVDNMFELRGYEPAVTEPPGELMYRWIGFWGLSASRKRS